MGTSNSYQGKKTNKKKNLKNLDYVSWTKAKSLMSKHLTSNGKIGKPKDIINNYIKASGYPTNYIKSTNQNIETLTRFSTLLTSIQDTNLIEAFNSLGISVSNISFEVVLSKLINSIFPQGATKKDAAVRHALVHTLNKHSNFGINNLKDFENITSEQIEELLIDLSTELIWQNMMIDYGFSFEKYGQNFSTTKALEKIILEYINSNVRNEFIENKSLFIDKLTIKNIYKEIIRDLELK
ncbi:MAG: hypothetical protein PQJ49_00680 [Sphaerochaetaceae bacterium]|nr:hypothetical protein [Sphaerochaetaceae bacterium]